MLKKPSRFDGSRWSTERWPAWLGARLGKVRLHTIKRRQRPERQPEILKRRRWFCPLLIGPGNLSLRLWETGLRVLPTSEWHARERAFHRDLYGIELENVSRGWLILPGWLGVVVADLGRSRHGLESERLRALGAASRALSELHRVEVVRAEGCGEYLSHGDATLRNVVFDPVTGKARWFDFDMDHVTGLCPDWRHGDDLRAMVYSAVELFADVPVATLLRTIRDAYTEQGAWEQLIGRLAKGALHRSPLHFAQAAPPESRRRELESLLLSRAGPLLVQATQVR